MFPSDNPGKPQHQILQTGEDRFRTLVEGHVDGLLVVTADGIIRLANPVAEKLLGKPAQELLGTPISFSVSPGETVELELSSSSGTLVSVEIRAAAVEWEGTESLLVALRDISDRYRAEEERRQLEAQMQYTQKLESLGVLAGGIAHDFNNILMTIVARAGLALRALGPNMPGRDHLQHIEKAGLRGGELANQMLTYAGRGKPMIQKVNVTNLLEGMSQLLQVSISKRAVLIHELAHALPPIQVDPSQLRQMVMTLLTNASEALGDQGGSITLRTGTIEAPHHELADWHMIGPFPEGLSVYIEVQDTGCGMPEDMLSKIFDPFFTTKFTGRGLGLAALLGIVRAHGGAVAVKSQPAQGTQVRLLFPGLKPRRPQPPPPTTPPLDWRGSGTILVVDDEEDVRIASRLILEEIGFRVLTADNGQSGFTVFQDHQQDISAVLLDLTMPHMNGQELFQSIRQLNARIPVLLSSGYTEEEALKRFAGSGISGFIQKPYQVEALIEKIRSVIETKPRPN